MHTFDSRHSIGAIDVHMVYFVPRDRTPLKDWEIRLSHFARRIEDFHHLEFSREQSTLRAIVHPQPLISRWTSSELRQGTADFTFYRTLEEADRAVLTKNGAKEGEPFQIVLVLSDMNYRPLDDFFRTKPGPSPSSRSAEDVASGEDSKNNPPATPRWEFEGSMAEKGTIHVPGAPSGGSRACYLADMRKGWGIVSADGWRVPYRGSDCVIYHEGVGHTIGLPHPEPQENSVMSHGQYAGWLNQSWVTPSQKQALGWISPQPGSEDHQDQESTSPGTGQRVPDEFALFHSFYTTVEPTVPAPGQSVGIRVHWDAARVSLSECVVEYQTRLSDLWSRVDVDLAQLASDDAGGLLVSLGIFEKETPVSYRCRALGKCNGDQQRNAEVYGYFQVRADPRMPLAPPTPEDVDPADREEFSMQDHNHSHSAVRLDAGLAAYRRGKGEVDLLALVNPERDAVSGTWTLTGDGETTPRVLESPKAYGSRIQLPHKLPREYRITLVAQPLDEPNALLVGQNLDGNRCLVLLSYAVDGFVLSAVENIHGHNVDRLENPTRTLGATFKRFRPSQVVYTVTERSIRVQVDGREWIHWEGDPASLALSTYWGTPNDEYCFLGTYDCRYRIHRMTLEELEEPDESAAVPAAVSKMEEGKKPAASEEVVDAAVVVVVEREQSGEGEGEVGGVGGRPATLHPGNLLRKRGSSRIGKGIARVESFV